MTPHDRKRHHALLLALWSNPICQDRMILIRKIADAAGAAERNFQRAVGADWEDAYRADWDTSAEVVVMLSGTGGTEVLTRFHMIENKNEVA